MGTFPVAPQPRRRTCQVEGCARDVVARGYCGMHYQRVVKHGDPHVRHEYWPERMREQLAELLDQGWSDVRIGRALGRSTSAVKKARMRFGMAPRYRRGHTARDVARIMGVNHMVPQRWIAAGRLPARTNTARYGRQRCLMVDHFDLCAFIADKANWHCYEPVAIADPSLRAWATRLRGDVRFVTVKEAARLIGCQYMQVWHWCARGRLRSAKDGGIRFVRLDDVESLARERGRR